MGPQSGADSAEKENSSVAALPEKSATVTCSICGCESPLTEYFQKLPKGMLCPRCYGQEWRSNRLNVYVSAISAGVLVIFVTGKLVGDFPVIPFLNLLLAFVWLWPIVCAHEVIHGVAAWLAGGRVFELALGSGKLLHSFRVRGTRFAWRQQQGTYLGFCAAAFPQRQYLRMRWLLYIMAPLTAQILLVLWLLPRFDWEHFGSGLAVVETLVLLNVVVVALNLWPRRYAGMRATDGYWIRELLRGTQPIDELHAAYFVLASQYAFEDEDFPAMQAAAEAGLALYPENSSLKNNLAASYLAQDRYVEGLALFEQFLADETVQGPFATRALYLCNRAFALFSLALEADGISEEQMAVAHASAAAAFSLLPWIDEVELVRAISVYFQGRYEIAVEYLDLALHPKQKASLRASGLAFMALAQYRLRQTDAARASLAEAWQVYPKGDRALVRISEIVGEGGGVSFAGRSSRAG